MALFDSLLELRWRDIAAPCESVETLGSHDVADHKRVDRNGARLEGTGRNPYQFDIRIPFINGLARGPQETWSDLFPTQFLAFQEALEDRSDGTLQHPLYGTVQCKPVSWKVNLNADQRGGVVVDVVFRETTIEASLSLGNSSALAAVNAAAVNLDAQLGQLNPPIDTGLPDDIPSFEDFANQLSAVGDQVELLQNKVVGKIDNVIASVNKISDGISKTANVIVGIPGTATTTLAPLGNMASRIVDSCTKLNFALIGLKSTLQTKDKTIAFYTTLADTTMASLSAQLNDTVEDLVALNPLLVSAPVVQPNTVVRYYKGGGLTVSSPFA